jgi:hypothetical protein
MTMTRMRTMLSWFSCYPNQNKRVPTQWAEANRTKIAICSSTTNDSFSSEYEAAAVLLCD